MGLVLLEQCPNVRTFDAFFKCERHLIDHHKVLVSVSGGSDSDIMLDHLQKVLEENKFNYDCEIHYVWFDTGLEYKVTKEHLDYLENKYNIKIERIRPKVPVPLGCKIYGVPFLTKYVSQMLGRLQEHNFDFKNDGNKSYEELMSKYPNMKSALRFWCCHYGNTNIKDKSHFNIDNFPYLKEFIIENPPTFKISDGCCKGAKKQPSHDYVKENKIDLKLLGLRKAEGGVRATNTKGCYTENSTKEDVYRPIWWFSDKDKNEYKNYYNIKHSDCYEIWGFKRTGCCCCPFGSNFEEELETVKKYEPNLYLACQNIFGKSYEYTRKYREFKKIKIAEARQLKGQMAMFVED